MEQWIYKKDSPHDIHFIYGDSYESVQNFLQHISNKTSPYAIVMGSNKSGKSHLLKYLQQNKGGIYLSKKKIDQWDHQRMLQSLYASSYVWADDITLWNSDMVFIFLKHITDNNSFCLCTINEKHYDTFMKTDKKDTISRLNTWPILKITPPTFTFTINLLDEYFKRYGIILSTKIIHKIAFYLPKDFQNILNFVKQVNKISKTYNISIDKSINACLKTYE